MDAAAIWMWFAQEALRGLLCADRERVLKTVAMEAAALADTMLQEFLKREQLGVFKRREAP